MDPIHPIVPVPPTIPPVSPAPLISRIDRDDRRRGADEDQRRRRSPRHATGTDGEQARVDEHDGEDDTGLHVNVTA